MSEIIEKRIKEIELEIAEELLREGDTIEKIAKVTRLPIEVVQELAAKIKPVTALY